LHKISLDIVGLLLYNRRAVGDYAFEKFSLFVQISLDIVGLLLYNWRAGAKIAEVSRQKYFLTQKVDYPYGQEKTHSNLRNGGKSSSNYYWRGGAKILASSDFFGGGPARRVPRGTSPWPIGTIFA
jgi:hypothetical protein